MRARQEPDDEGLLIPPSKEGRRVLSSGRGFLCENKDVQRESTSLRTECGSRRLSTNVWEDRLARNQVRFQPLTETSGETSGKQRERGACKRVSYVGTVGSGETSVRHHFIVMVLADSK